MTETREAKAHLLELGVHTKRVVDNTLYLRIDDDPEPDGSVCVLARKGDQPGPWSYLLKFSGDGCVQFYGHLDKDLGFQLDGGGRIKVKPKEPE